MQGTSTNLCRYSKAGINQYDTYKGHAGAITGLHFHPLSGPVDFSDLFLTSSVDWTVKLWRAKVMYRLQVFDNSYLPVLIDSFSLLPKLLPSLPLSCP
jgi:hypothetical protein